MLQNKKVLIAGFIIPIIVLVGMTIQAEHNFRAGIEVILPIQGYDPRDFLSGHYLIYTIDYGFDPCPSKTEKEDTYLCLDYKLSSLQMPENCPTVIKGTCNFGSFTAGIEKFYASEASALNLQTLINQQPMSVVLSVTKNGSAQVKYLLVDGKRWEVGK